MDLEFDVSLGFDNLGALGDYEVYAEVSDQVDIWGDGDFKFQLRNFSIDAAVAINYENKYFQLKEIEVDLDLEKLDVMIKNLLGGGAVSELISGIISDVGPEFLREFSSDIKEIISVKGRELVNDHLLKQFDVYDLVDRLAGKALKSLGV